MIRQKELRPYIFSWCGLLLAKIRQNVLFSLKSKFFAKIKQKFWFLDFAKAAKPVWAE